MGRIISNNTIMPNESDAGVNKRKRLLKENERKSCQKKTLWSYFHSSKNEEPDSLNGTDVRPETSVSEGKKSSQNDELQDNMEIVDEKTEPEKISHSACELKSSISEPENMDKNEVKSENSSENQISASSVEKSETEEPQDNASVDDMKETEPEKTNQQSLQMASTSTINDEGSENLNGTEVNPESSISESQTSQEKASECEEPQDIEKNEDNKEQEEINQEHLQMDSVVNDEGPESLDESEVKPGTSNESHASTSGEKASENEGSEDDVENIDEIKESDETSQESSEEAVKLKPAFVDWRSDSYSVTCLPKKAREKGLFADIQFVMGEGDKRRQFHAHKSILACASSVFEKMFFGPLPEERDIIETNDDPDAFEMLLDYIYGTSCNIHDTKPLTSVCKFSEISDKYAVPKVQETVEMFMLFHSITENDFWDIFEVSNFNTLWSQFRDKLESYIMENADVLVPSEKFLNVPETIVNSVLQMNKLNIEEYPLLVGVTKWAYHNKKQVTANILMEYYKHIRFSRMSTHKLIEFIDSYPEALDAETYLQILQHLHTPSAHDLPKWCSSSKKSRIKALERSKRERDCSCTECDENSDDDAGCKIQ